MRLKYFLYPVLVIGVFEEDSKRIKRLLDIIIENFMAGISDLTEEDAEDLAQKVLMQIWQSLVGFWTNNKDKKDDPEIRNRFGSHATTINKCRLIDEYRKRKEKTKVEFLSLSGSGVDQSLEGDSSGIIYEIGSCEPTQSNDLEYEELCQKRDEIRNSAKTPSQKRAWLVLDYLEDGKTYADAAETMGISDSTLKSDVRRLNEYLVNELSKCGWDC